MWRVKVYKETVSQFSNFHSPLDCHSFLWDRHVTRGNFFNSCDNHQGQSQPSSISDEEKKVASYSQDTKIETNPCPQKSLEFQRWYHHRMKFFKNFPGGFKSSITSLTHPLQPLPLSSPSTTLKPSKVNFCLPSPLYFLLEGSTRNLIPLLRMKSRKAF